MTEGWLFRQNNWHPIEFLFFHFVAGHPWPALLANYDLLNGRVWVLLLAWLAIAFLTFFIAG